MDPICVNSDAYAKLLESGDLKSSCLKLEGVNMPFHHLLARICFHHHFSGRCWGKLVISLIAVHHICSVDIVDKYQVLKCWRIWLMFVNFLKISEPQPAKDSSYETCDFFFFFSSKPLMYYLILQLFFWNSCGEDRLLCLNVQQVNPGSPCLFAGQNRKFYVLHFFCGEFVLGCFFFFLGGVHDCWDKAVTEDELSKCCTL